MAAQAEVTYESSKEWLARVWFLSNVSMEFLVQLSLTLRPLVFAPGEVTPPGRLYIIKGGACGRHHPLCSHASILMSLRSHARSSCRDHLQTGSEIYSRSTAGMQCPGCTSRVRRRSVWRQAAREGEGLRRRHDLVDASPAVTVLRPYPHCTGLELRASVGSHIVVRTSSTYSPTP